MHASCFLKEGIEQKFRYFFPVSNKWGQVAITGGGGMGGGRGGPRAPGLGLGFPTITSHGVLQSLAKALGFEIFHAIPRIPWYCPRRHKGYSSSVWSRLL